MKLCTLARVMVFVAGSSAAQGQIVIPTVPILDAPNASDPATGSLYGAVPYTFRIGTYEVTNAQYAAFLNAVGATDGVTLYDPAMAGPYGGITRSGSQGSFTYATIPHRASYPVNYVLFWSACRFANWLHNGQPRGPLGPTTTEDGAYTLTTAGINANTVTRNADWRWAIPSGDEWYKAAYHQFYEDGGDADNYWRYPTSSNSISLLDANYEGSAIKRVGMYAPNFHGVFDLAGNICEWTEVIDTQDARIARGGHFTAPEFDLRAGVGLPVAVLAPLFYQGFRVVEHIFCPADFDRSGFVDSDDFVAFVSQFALGCVGPGQGAFGPEPACFKSADFDASGFVDADDFVGYIEAFETFCVN